MKFWTLQPRDALALRDGRQMWEGANAPRSLEIPWPSTLAGAARNAIYRGRPIEYDVRSPDGQTALRQIAIASGWLVLHKTDYDPGAAYLRAPADCLWFRAANGDHKRVPLAPNGERLPDDPFDGGLQLETLAPVVDVQDDWESAESLAAYWSAAEVSAWLAKPETDSPDGRFGLPGLSHELVVHNAINPQTGASVDGALFRSDRVFYHSPRGQGWLSLGLACDHAHLDEGLLTLGGDRAVARLAPDPQARFAFSRKEFEACKRLRIMLITPGLFAKGYVPSSEMLEGATVNAAVVGRAEIISGWDLALRQPRPARRAAPAGSVYWLEPPRGTSCGDLAERLWMKSVCDDAEDRTSGFGLVLVGRGSHA